ncbi:MAG: DNA-packaging protein [Alphaproteobacteria bacterium]|nr:DNA-packaging protein [Alphaproteobacteria bacterium]MBV9372403.1 DNA-packaging protein [Alphaproteobacteria bacterium]MBV9902044.1 DNA-packaging protein [Alphaproteobacteria bacterium]
MDGLPYCIKSAIPAGGGDLTRAQKLAVLRALARLTRDQRRMALQTFPAAMVQALAEEWWWGAHGGQVEPKAADNGEPWRVWAIVAGRGFGKTRAGAEWVWARAREDSNARIALVAATIDEVERVMVKGESGLLNIGRAHEHPRWIASKNILLFPSGAEAHAFSAERPEKLRGPQHHFAWCDELAKWPHADDTWNNLMLGLRLGERPRTVVTTTPRPVPLLKRLLGLPRCARTEGRTNENPHLPADFRHAVQAMFANTRLGRQELDGLLLDEFEGALWTRDLLEKARHPSPTWGEGRLAEGERGEGFTRIVIGLDPPASTGGDSCGIVVCARDEDGICWVLADLTASGLSPEAWARRVAEAARLYGAVKVVAEKNQGGDMIASILRAVDADLPVKLVHAGASKAARAEPIALRFETGGARLAGHFPELEDQLCALTWNGYQGPGSPDRADAMVWAMTELFEKQQAEPRVRRL